jgi:hypothetical protein
LIDDSNLIIIDEFASIEDKPVPVKKDMILNQESFEAKLDLEDQNPGIKSDDPLKDTFKDANDDNTNSRYQPYDYDKSKSLNQEIDKCGVLHLSNQQINKLNTLAIAVDLPIITLSMAKMLTISSLSGDMRNICSTINMVGYYMQQSWRAYKSHRRKMMCLIEFKTPL